MRQLTALLLCCLLPLARPAQAEAFIDSTGRGVELPSPMREAVWRDPRRQALSALLPASPR